MNSVELEALCEGPHAKPLSKTKLVAYFLLWLVYENSDAMTGMRDRSLFPLALDLRTEFELCGFRIQG